MSYEIDLFLVKIAVELAAQEALAKELTRQVSVQEGCRCGITFTNLDVQATINETNIRLDGRPVKFVNRP